MTRNEWILGLFDCDTSAFRFIKPTQISENVTNDEEFNFFSPLILLSDSCSDKSFSASIIYAFPS